jgi:general secretion pathway protein C
MSLAHRIRTDVPMVLLRLALVGTGAVVAADAVNQWALARWQGPALAPPPPAAAVAAAPAPRGPGSFAAITRRDIFNSAPQAAPAPVRVRPHQAPTAVVEPLNLNVRLTGTVVGNSPDGSFAMILDVAARDEHLYRLGDKVLGEGLVAEIGRDSVRLTRGGAEQILRLFEEEQAGATVTVAPGAVQRQEVTPDQFRFSIDRGEVDEALGDLPRLLTQARLLPNFRSGQTDGFRIFNIVPGSLFARIGLQNGDVLHRVNDVAIEDPAKFMGIFEALKNESQITLDLVRGNERKTFEYEIR